MELGAPLCPSTIDIASSLGEQLILPYGVSDGAVGIATVPVRELLAALV